MENIENVKDELFTISENIIIAGSDEAGRGPLAGPVVAATVVLPSDFPIEILNDSKKLSAKDRDVIEIIIKEKALSYSVSVIDAEVIDKINILQASLLAMKNSFNEVNKKLNMKVDLLLVDGNKTPSVSVNVKAIVKGDSKIPQIMAASILAKNERDRIMTRFHSLYPNFSFDKHFGYPTKKHYEEIEKYGITPIHRLSFRLYKEKDNQNGQLELF